MGDVFCRMCGMSTLNCGLSANIAKNVKSTKQAKSQGERSEIYIKWGSEHLSFYDESVVDRVSFS